MSPVERFLDLPGIRLRLLDFGGRGSPVLILHGLAGRASEWSEVATDLSRKHKVLALDLRGHGGSDKPPGGLARRSFVSDAIGVLELLEVDPVCLLGQSFGGDIALTVAATRPDLLSSVVVIEASPDLDAQTRTAIAEWFRSWPERFASLDQARSFFMEAGLQHPDLWLSGLGRTERGYEPDFRPHDMASILEHTEEGLWHLLPDIEAPTLLITGEAGLVPREDAHRMIQTIPRARHELVQAAGHNVHLDDPTACRDLIEGFLGGLGSPR